MTVRLSDEYVEALRACRPNGNIPSWVNQVAVFEQAIESEISDAKREAEPIHGVMSIAEITAEMLTVRDNKVAALMATLAAFRSRHMVPKSTILPSGSKAYDSCSWSEC
jgi:hypothetical protein